MAATSPEEPPPSSGPMPTTDRAEGDGESTEEKQLSTSCPLFRLPRELRDKIYSYVLTQPHPIWWPTERASNGLWPALLAVSRRVHSEAAPHLHTTNAFMFAHPSDCNMFARTHSRPHTRLIQTLYLHVRDRDMPLWRAYLSSTNADRSLAYDLPDLKSVYILYRSSFWNPHPGELRDNYFRWQQDPRLRDLCLSLEDKTKATVNIYCIHRIPRMDVEALRLSYPDHLKSDPGEDVVRTDWVKIVSCYVRLELSPVDQHPAS
ncbi:hypothetical protein BDY21DRAFT_3197 [Lineolata rhizophorae]|uniref:F-box domain-containing protein n=1 Tax=Lineolata rhizophorae TaxID=578093 RepID=A0A6A6PD59_9PEZI|nr:hypothetical protein BDY21DRAFT_3197 [Lineolata rhizophorae]